MEGRDEKKKGGNTLGDGGGGNRRWRGGMKRRREGIREGMRREEGKGEGDMHYRSFQLKGFTKRSTCTKVREEEGREWSHPPHPTVCLGS